MISLRNGIALNTPFPRAGTESQKLDMTFLNSHQKIVLQSLLAFFAGSQIVHLYMNPLKDFDNLVEEKKSKLWQEYLRKRAEVKQETNKESSISAWES